MMSERNDGGSIAEITGKYLGPVMQNVMRVFSVVLLIMVGTVFAVGPAGLIVTLCKNSGGGADTYWSKNKGKSKESVLKKVTVVLGVLYFALALVLSSKFI